MSTKGLMADKRVKEVTLNALGKADTLTLADGWTFEGSPGPFKLTNVDHGHKIVKSATNPNAPGRAARAPREKAQPSGQPSDPSQPYTPPEPSPQELRKITKRIDVSDAVYRVMMSNDKHEVTGWIRTTRPIPGPQIAARATDLLASHPRVRSEPNMEPSGYRWTAEHEREARKANDAGCPWPSLFRPGQSNAHDAPFNPGVGQ